MCDLDWVIPKIKTCFLKKKSSKKWKEWRLFDWYGDKYYNLLNNKKDAQNIGVGTWCTKNL